MKRFLLFVGCAVLCMTARAYYVQDSGHITDIFVNQNGAIAVRLDNGFPNSVANFQCPPGDGTWAGNASPNPALMAALMLAKSKGYTVVVVTQGCDSGWFKIENVYVKQ
jgi:hypothetical protein